MRPSEGERVMRQVRAFCASRPVGRRIPISRLYGDYVELFSEPFLSSRGLSCILRELGATPYRTGSARGYVFGTPEEIASAPTTVRWGVNADRAIRYANQQLAATMAQSEQDSPDEEWWK